MALNVSSALVSVCMEAQSALWDLSQNCHQQSPRTQDWKLHEQKQQQSNFLLQGVPLPLIFCCCSAKVLGETAENCRESGDPPPPPHTHPLSLQLQGVAQGHCSIPPTSPIPSSGPPRCKHIFFTLRNDLMVASNGPH